MNIASRLKYIEKRTFEKHGQGEMVVLTEYNSKYYMEKYGIKIEVEKPEDDQNKLIVILKSYSDYEMQKDIK